MVVVRCIVLGSVIGRLIGITVAMDSSLEMARLVVLVCCLKGSHFGGAERDAVESVCRKLQVGEGPRCTLSLAKQQL